MSQSESFLLAKYCTEIDAIPFQYPIQHLKIDGNDLWPIFKNYLYRRAIIKSRNPKNNLSNNYVYQIFPSQKWLSLFKQNYNAVNVDIYPEGKTDFVFFSDQGTIAQARVNGITYDTIMDGIIVKAKKYGQCKKIMLLKQDCQLGNYFILPDFILYSQISYSRTHILNEYLDDFASFLEARLRSLDLRKTMIFGLLDMFYTEYTSIYTLLKKIQPKCIFSYPMVHNHILLNAAKRIGIPVVDVQHGNIESSYVYNNWDELYMLDEKKFLPDFFLVWNKETEEQLKEQFGNCSIIVSGNQWIDFINDNKENFECRHALNSFFKSYKYIVTIVFTQERILEDLIYDIITSYRATELGIGFVIRYRPNYPIPLNIPCVKNCFFAQDTMKVPFYILAQNSNLILTSGSTALMEADRAGIDTFLYGSESIIYHYPKLYREGKVEHIESVYDFYEKFEKNINKEYTQKFTFGDSSDLEIFLSVFTKKIQTKS